MIIKEMNFHCTINGDYMGDDCYLCGCTLHKFFDFTQCQNITLIAHTEKGKGRVKIHRTWFGLGELRVNHRWVHFEEMSKRLIKGLVKEYKVIYVELKKKVEPIKKSEDLIQLEIDWDKTGRNM